jgi:hypothetical protein
MVDGVKRRERAPGAALSLGFYGPGGRRPARGSARYNRVGSMKPSIEGFLRDAKPRLRRIGAFSACGGARHFKLASQARKRPAAAEPAWKKRRSLEKASGLERAAP